MKVNVKDTPRKFTAGLNQSITASDWGSIHLDPSDLVTVFGESGEKYDVFRTDWGFYPMPSLNRSLVNSGFRCALVGALKGKYFIMLVERAQEQRFFDYMEKQQQRLIAWLDNDEIFAKLETLLA